MKKLTLTFLAIAIMIDLSAQVPQALNYQAIARNSLGQIVPSQSIGVRFTILDATGATTFYQETHTTTTNNFGLFTLSIGKGTATSGTIPSIDWSTGGDKYLKVEIAPQGGTNYTIQGTTQLLSVPYALYAEKTKLVAGNAITITNGNTINANYVAGNAITITGSTISGNYQAGPGISITGNTITSTLNPWLLSGNAGTTATNFLGTTDNKPLNIRTNNLQRLSISESTVVGTTNLSYVSAGQLSDFATNPVQLSVWGKDMAGYQIPFGVAGNVTGMTWGTQVGNTLGRLMRLAQYTTAAGPNYQFFDIGIDQAGDYFVGDNQLWNDGNIAPKKMITISPQDFVGVNFNWGEHPTANFHTKGTVRFEGVNTNNALTNVLVMDASGNVATRDASTLTGSSTAWALAGNAGTTASNFVGTTDDQRLYFRTNNITRMYIDKMYSGFGVDVGAVYISDDANIQTRPGQLDIFGKDVAGLSIPLAVTGTVNGATWGTAGGNTSGRLIRLIHMGTANFSSAHFYDIGIQRDSSFYLSSLGLQNVGGLLPKPMITISAQNNVGINMDWAVKPTANFHTKGTVRFEGVNTNNALTRFVAMDANGNVASRDASTLLQWTPDASGIHYSSGNVGVGANSGTNAVFNVMGSNSLPYTLEVNSTQTWQTALSLFNTTSNMKWYFTAGGSANTQPTYGVGMGNFGIARETFATPVVTTFPILIAADDKVGIGMGIGGSNNFPKAQLHIKTGDVYIEQITSGVIMKSPNGQCWRMTVSNAGTPVFTAIACP